MGYGLSEYLTAQFYAWEKRGRGWNLFNEPVHLEPKFIPFLGHFSPEPTRQIDSGIRPRFFPGIQELLGLHQTPTSNLFDEKVFVDLEKTYKVNAYPNTSTDPVTELQINFDRDTRISAESIEQLLLMLSTVTDSVGFEIIGTKEKIIIQFVCGESQADQFKSYIGAYAPDVLVQERPGTLENLLDPNQVLYCRDLGLRDEFMCPLRVWNKFEPDPLSGCIAALELIESGELGMVQVLFQSVSRPWAESMYRSVTDSEGNSFFGDAPEMLALTKEKVSSPLYATVIRIVSQASTPDRANAISAHIAHTFNAFHRVGSNSLVPLEGSSCYDLNDLLLRRSRRIGMLLNSDELTSFVHIPDRSVVSSKLRAYSGKTNAASSTVIGHPFKLGINTHLGQETTVSVSDQQRLRHMHVMGATGTGKSSFLRNLIIQDIAQGRGVTVLDPHGDLIDVILTHVPDERLQDVILVDPADTEYPIGLNLLSAHTEGEKIVLSSDMIALFRRFATSWGDQMTSVLANAINAILESSGGTLIDLRRFLVEPGFRNTLLKTVEDPSILYYWKHEFPLLRQTAIAPILTRLDTFLRPRIVRNMMAQKTGLDFGQIVNTQKILLIKLAHGAIGEENSYLLGTLFVMKLHQAALSRQAIAPEDRTPYYLYIDEFQNFITPSMSAILSGARKYGLGLVLAHQDLDQLLSRDAELANSVLSNPAIRVFFRCGDKDAAKLEDGFLHFDSTDLQSLSVGQAIMRVGQKDYDFNVTFDLVPKAESSVAEGKRRTIIEHCRSTYALLRSDVEQMLRDALQLGTVSSRSDSEPEVVQESKAPLPDRSIEAPFQQKETEIDLAAEAQKFVTREAEKEKLREHRFLQEYIKSVGEARNFKAVLEEPVNNGAGKVDVSLHRDGLKLACEISVTNTVEYEVQNIQKCLDADYLLVFMLSNDLKHLHAIRTLTISVVDPSLHKRIFFVSKDEFVSQLDLLLVQQAQPTEVRTKGYRVKINYSSSNDGNGQQKALKDIILSSLQRRDKG